jgi:hypothetical protein
MKGSSIFMPRLFVALFFLTASAQAQFTYTLDQSVPVTGTDDSPLHLAWSGGLNSAQISTMHLDDDNKEDLVIFDRSGGKVLTYLNKNDHYEYRPDYESFFPTLGQWLLLRDFNCDGRKDIFTSHPFGIAVHVNVTQPGGTLTWREFNPGSPLLTKGFSGSINLKVNETDIPAIDDIDGDGDLDILNFRFVGAGTIEYHKNFSIERSGVCDSMQMERITQDYGSVEECACGRFAFGTQTCDDILGGGRTQHVGGKSLLTIDMDNDGDRELLFSEESCAALYMMPNTGSSEVPIFQTASSFPQSNPAAFRFFPASYYEDLDFDGKKDLIVSPNLFARVAQNSVVKESVWFYKNSGADESPNFNFVKRNFLQDQMIDVGDYSTPAFFDADGDGDEDLFIGKYAADENFLGTIVCYENTGTPSAPAFKLIVEDLAGLTGLFNYNFKPFFADMNADGKTDLAWTSTSLTNGFTSLQYIPNNKASGLGLETSDYVITPFRIGQPESLYATDVNQDGRIDLLVGRSTGALQYYENRNTSNMFDQMVRVSDAFLGIGSSTSRQNPAVATSDLDGDGFQDLVMANQRGQLAIYGDYRIFAPSVSQPYTEIIYNSLLEASTSKNLGARLWPTITNLFGTNRPAIVVGNTMGGVQILKNTEGIELPEEPVVIVFPNPLERGEALKIKSDRNVLVQIFSVLGQKMSEPTFVPGGQIFPLAINNVATGMYIARFSYGHRSVSVRFVLK